MSWAAHQAITPAVLERLELAIVEMPKRNRPTYVTAALVLFHLAKCQRSDADRPVDETVSQIATALRIHEKAVKRSLDAIEQAGLTRVVKRGSRTNEGGRGSRRLLSFIATGDAQASRDDEADEAENANTDTETRNSHGRTGDASHRTGDASHRTGDAQASPSMVSSVVSSSKTLAAISENGPAVAATPSMPGARTSRDAFTRREDRTTAALKEDSRELPLATRIGRAKAIAHIAFMAACDSEVLRGSPVRRMALSAIGNLVGGLTLLRHDPWPPDIIDDDVRVWVQARIAEAYDDMAGYAVDRPALRAVILEAFGLSHLAADGTDPNGAEYPTVDSPAGNALAELLTMCKQAHWPTDAAAIERLNALIEPWVEAA